MVNPRDATRVATDTAAGTATMALLGAPVGETAALGGLIATSYHYALRGMVVDMAKGDPLKYIAAKSAVYAGTMAAVELLVTGRLNLVAAAAFGATAGAGGYYMAPQIGRVANVQLAPEETAPLCAQ